MKITKVVRILLCLVPALCFLILPSLAADFTDAAAIGQAYRNAVDEMAARGVLAGFPDGSFKPGEALTREQGAKIVACLCLGKSEAEKLRSETPRRVRNAQASAGQRRHCAAGGPVRNSDFPASGSGKKKPIRPTERASMAKTFALRAAAAERFPTGAQTCGIFLPDRSRATQAQ